MNHEIELEMNTTKHQKIASLLIDVEYQLRELDYWQQDQPLAQDLSSSLPFCHDTLRFEQWLQFIFLPKMQMMIDANSPLPDNCAIAPYAEEYFKQATGVKKLLAHLSEIDHILSNT